MQIVQKDLDWFIEYIPSNFIDDKRDVQHVAIVIHMACINRRTWRYEEKSWLL